MAFNVKLLIGSGR